VKVMRCCHFDADAAMLAMFCIALVIKVSEKQEYPWKLLSRDENLEFKSYDTDERKAQDLI
jgi:hypothetical protein